MIAELGCPHLAASPPARPAEFKPHFSLEPRSAVEVRRRDKQALCADTSIMCFPKMRLVEPAIAKHTHTFVLRGTDARRGTLQ